VILLLYVDDILIASNSKSEVEKLKYELSREFEMKDLGAANRKLGIEIKQDRKRNCCICPRSYISEKLLKGLECQIPNL